ncbi:hypothetical protein NJ7G_2447 [Natrinema sp. J7-2]|nr:hypothetical protein NJ7G_2447 [Natrinema sp. J7-2]
MPFQDQDVPRSVFRGEGCVLRGNRREHVAARRGCGEELTGSVECGRRGHRSYVTEYGGIRI